MSHLADALRAILGRVSNELNTDDVCLADSSEKIVLSSLALIKMLRHGRAGIPMEVMGLMLGEFVDEYTINVVDVFSMPQSGNTVSVEAVDPVYQTEMLEMFKRIERPEMVVGWYHSHPGFGCWLSGTDITTQESFEQLHKRAVGVVVDPVQSVKGSVVLDCFRLIQKTAMMLNLDARQINSNIGHCARPNINAILHGLNKHYYSLTIGYRQNPLEEKLLLSLMEETWSDRIKQEPYADHRAHRIARLTEMRKLTHMYAEQIEDDLSQSNEEKILKRVGTRDVRKQLRSVNEELISSTIFQALKTNSIAQMF